MAEKKTAAKKPATKRTTTRTTAAPAPAAVDEEQLQAQANPSPGIAPGEHGDSVLTLPLDKVFPDPDQPRKAFDQGDLVELGENIRANGQLMPVRVSADTDSPGNYRLEDGERRYRACMLAGIDTIRAVVVPAASGEERLVRQMSANTGKPLLPMETAHGYKRLADAGWDIDRIAKAFGVSAELVRLDLKLCDCEKPIQDAVDKGFSKSVARRLSELEPTRQMGAFERAVKAHNDKGKLAAIEAYLNQQAQKTVFTEIRETADGEKVEAKKAWGAFKSGFSKFTQTPYSNGKGIILVGAMKSQAHRDELEKTAREMIKVANSLLSHVENYKAAVEQNKPLAA